MVLRWPGLAQRASTEVYIIMGVMVRNDMEAGLYTYQYVAAHLNMSVSWKSDNSLVGPLSKGLKFLIVHRNR